MFELATRARSQVSAEAATLVGTFVGIRRVDGLPVAVAAVDVPIDGEGEWPPLEAIQEKFRSQSASEVDLDSVYIESLCLQPMGTIPAETEFGFLLRDEAAFVKDALAQAAAAKRLFVPRSSESLLCKLEMRHPPSTASLPLGPPCALEKAPDKIPGKIMGDRALVSKSTEAEEEARTPPKKAAGLTEKAAGTPPKVVKAPATPADSSASEALRNKYSKLTHPSAGPPTVSPTSVKSRPVKQRRTAKKAPADESAALPAVNPWEPSPPKASALFGEDEEMNGFMSPVEGGAEAAAESAENKPPSLQAPTQSTRTVQVKSVTSELRDDGDAFVFTKREEVSIKEVPLQPTKPKAVKGGRNESVAGGQSITAFFKPVGK